MSYIDEHKELYEKLDYYLKEFTKLKNKRDDEFLINTSKHFYVYIDKLLSEHFVREEKELFPEVKKDLDKEIFEKITNDHDEIRSKFKILKTKMQTFIENQDLDYKTEILFPTYNLIATINHHAQREDRHIFKLH